MIEILATIAEASGINKPEIGIPIIVSILSLGGVGTLTSMFGKDRHDKKIANTRQKQEEAKRERMAEMKEATKESFIDINTRLDTIENKLSDMHNHLELNNTGTQAGLRYNLLFAYYDCARKGYRTRNDSENFGDMYHAYHNLGGNSFVEKDLIKGFEELPSKEEYRKQNDQFKKGE